MKIPDEILRMSKARRREWIKAIDEVYEGYKESTFVYTCPFCEIAPYECDSCLWKIFEEITCLRFVQKKKSIGSLPEPGDDSYPKWKRIRYPMLRKWRRMLVEAGI